MQFAHLIQTARCFKTPRRLAKGGNAASERYCFPSMGISEKCRKWKKDEAEADGDDTVTLGPRADAQSPTWASANTNSCSNKLMRPKRTTNNEC
jgi:hypothetical protein